MAIAFWGVIDLKPRALQLLRRRRLAAETGKRMGRQAGRQAGRTT